MEGSSLDIRYYATERAGDEVRPVTRRLLVRDFGAALGEPLVDRLAFAPADLRSDAEPLDGDPAAPDMTVELRPGFDGAVELSSDGRTPLAYPPGEVPSEVLSRMCGLELAHGGASWLHAAAVSDGSTTILLVGESGAGKSTLAAHLCARGFDLLSDEQVALHSECGEVTSFTRPLLLKPGSRPWAPAVIGPLWDAGPMLVRPAEMGVSSLLRAEPTHVAFIRRDEHGPATILPLPPPEAAEQLCLSSLDLAARPEVALAGIGWLSSAARAATVSYPSSAEGAVAIVDWAVRTPPTSIPPAWRLHSWRPLPASEGIVRNPQTLVLDIGAELLVFHRRTRVVVRLNEPAVELWHQLPLPTDTSAESDGMWRRLARMGLADIIIGGERVARRRRFAAAMGRSRPDM